MSCIHFKESLSSELILHAHESNTIKQLLLNGADINYQSKDGWCLLFELISLNSSQTIFDLQNYNLDLHIKDNKERSALFWAIHYEFTDVINTLISMHYNIEENICNGLHALHYAVYKNNIHIVNLLLDTGLNIEIKDKYNNTAISYAMRYKHKEMTTLLQQRGAVL